MSTLSDPAAGSAATGTGTGTDATSTGNGTPTGSPRPARRSIASRGFVPWVVPIVVLAIWQAAGSLGGPNNFLPAPLEVIEAAVRLAERGSLQTDVLISTRRALIGLVIGGSIGFVLGLLNGVSRLAERLFDTSLQMVRTIPHLALIPLVILWFGIGEEAKIFLVALGVAFPIYLNTFNGIKNIDQRLLEMALIYRIPKRQLFTQIVIPGAMPSILVGFRYALGIMWMSLIVAETIGADSGIGYMATTAREFVQMDVVVLSIILYAILGKLSDVIAVQLERRFLRWNPVFAKRTTKKSKVSA
jgi:sulfonate transport system permease protein